MKSQFFLLFISFLLWNNSGICQENLDVEIESNPLSGFEPLIGGEWYQDGGYQTFEWGVGKKSVITEIYFIMDGEAQKVSEGVWFWHPGEQQIKGYFTAINMPVEFFDYTTRFTEEGLESDLSAYDSSGDRTRYTEAWIIEDEDQISWILYSLDGDEKTQVMQGGLRRQLEN
jgi:hypothetical protein